MDSRGSGRVLGAGCIAFVLMLGAGCATVWQRSTTRPYGVVATCAEGRRSVPASNVATPHVAAVSGVVLRSRAGATRRVAVVRAETSPLGGSTDRQTSRAEYAAHLVAESGMAVAERLDVSLAK